MNKSLIHVIFLISFSLSNDAFMGSEGGNIFPEIHENIQMVKEEIRITLEKDHYIAKCKFWFKNHGEKQEVTMGFPDYYETPGSSNISLSNFKTVINGKNIEIYPAKKIINYPSSNDEMFITKWYSWGVQFNNNEEMIIENSYKGKYGSSLSGTANVSYIIGTGMTWFKHIEDGRITFDISNIISSNFIDTTDFGNNEPNKKIMRHIYPDSVVFSFRDYKPKFRDYVGFAFYPYWKSFYGNPDLLDTTYKYLHDTFERNSTSKNAIRLMRNEIFARKGYIFKSDELNQYFQKFNWYKANPNTTISDISDYEKFFVYLIKQYENK